MMTDSDTMSETTIRRQSTKTAVSARGVKKSYRNGRRLVPVLNDVDLTVGAGEILAIMGPSGCGKTTFLNCLSGLAPVDEGTITVGDVELSRASDRVRTQLRAKHMGFVFQSFNLIPVITALKNVQLPLELNGVARYTARKRAMESLEMVSMQERAEHRPTELSGGEQQRVAIARALVNNPTVVWADEPTGNLDRKTGEEVLEVFGRLNRDHGTTFVIVTHDPRVAESAHRTVHMDTGRIVGAPQA